MSRVYSAAAFAGRPPASAEAQARAATRAMVSSGVMPQSSALSAAQVIYSLPTLSGAAWRQLTALTPALFLNTHPTDKQTQDEVLAKLLTQFSTLGGLRSLVTNYAGASMAQLPGVASALKNQADRVKTEPQGIPARGTA